MIIYLYVKTHNVTGLKYFGKTIKTNVSKYKGSGTRWINHIKKHKYDVTTVIVGIFDDIEKCRAFALEFSILNDIVNSNEWANLEIESITGFGNFKNITTRQKARNTLKNNKKGIEFDNEARKLGNKTILENNLGFLNDKIREKGLKKALSQESREKRLLTFKNNNHQIGQKNNQYGTRWITNGVLSKKIKIDEDIPHGWKYGRITK